MTSVLHTWGSALTHHPHVHMIVPGGGISLDGSRWVSCRPGFFLPVRVLSRVFRRLFLERPTAAHQQLAFFGQHAPLANAQAFATYLAPLHKTEWVVYAKRTFGSLEAVLAYLSRYTHRVAIANSRLIAFDQDGVTFRWKDYRIEGRDRYKLMTLTTDEFIRRFLIHVLPRGFHRIRHYGLLAKAACADNIARARELLAVPIRQAEPADIADDNDPHPCPHCGGRMIIIETFARGSMPRRRPQGPNGHDQDRHVMTTSRARKSARSLRWFSASGRSARSNIQLSTQIEHEPSPFDACNLLLVSRIAIGQGAGSSRLRSPRHLRQSNPHNI
jgi:hypothetical protein